MDLDARLFDIRSVYEQYYGKEFANSFYIKQGAMENSFDQKKVAKYNCVHLDSLCPCQMDKQFINGDLSRPINTLFVRMGDNRFAGIMSISDRARVFVLLREAERLKNGHLAPGEKETMQNEMKVDCGAMEKMKTAQGALEFFNHGLVEAAYTNYEQCKKLIEEHYAQEKMMRCLLGQPVVTEEIALPASRDQHLRWIKEFQSQRENRAS
jgi:hypothetical protein